MKLKCTVFVFACTVLATGAACAQSGRDAGRDGDSDAWFVATTAAIAKTGWRPDVNAFANGGPGKVDARFVGTWQGSTSRGDGTRELSVVSLKEDGTFKLRAIVPRRNEAGHMDAFNVVQAGRWGVERDQFSLVLTRSSEVKSPRPGQSGLREVFRIDSVAADQLSYSSASGGGYVLERILPETTLQR